MASWLKVAEDLLEVVDRRAKLVVGELADDQPAQQGTTASNVEEANAKRVRSKDKTRLKQSNTTKGNKAEQTEKRKESTAPDTTTEKTSNVPIEKTPVVPDVGSGGTTSTDKEPSLDNHENGAELMVKDDKAESNDTNLMETKPVDANITTSNSNVNEDVPTNSKDQLEPPLHPVEKGSEVVSITHPTDADASTSFIDEGTTLTVSQDKSDSKTVKSLSKGDTVESKRDVLPEPSPATEKQPVLDQLEEAQGLLQSTVKTGQSKEARLARVCAGLSSRLQEYKAENMQLEELLVAERELSSSYEARIKQLQQDLSSSKLDVSRVESSMSDALAAKNSEIEALVSSLDLLKKQATTSEEKLTSLQNDMENISRSRELTETRMIQALREELASAERRAEEERIAHGSTKKAAVERELELEHRAVEASNALARIQRSAEESTSRAADLEHKVTLLEVECASLNQELQDMEARSRRNQKKSQEEANQILQVQAWQEEVERARQGQREAENKLSTLEAETQKLRVEMAGMKRDAEHYSRQEHMELEKRYRELTDLLYHKQTQLESMASEKAALEFQLDKELRRLQEAQLEAERSRAIRRSASSWEEDTDMKALEPLPLHHRHMAKANVQLQKAAKLLDTGAVRATRFLWRYPTARVILLFYLVFVHLFLMYLLHRLQEQADIFSNKEDAVSMGLGNSSLP